MDFIRQVTAPQNRFVLRISLLARGVTRMTFRRVWLGPYHQSP
jgi:hypothetical protein